MDYENLLTLPFVSRINLEDRHERLFYKKIISVSGLENCYSNSWAYIWQIAAGGASFKFSDGNHLISLTPGWGKSFPDELIINSTQNKESAEIALAFAKKSSAILGYPIFIRKVYSSESKDWFNGQAGLLRVEKGLQNDIVTDLPDDNYPERIVDIAEQLNHHGKSYQWLRNGLNYFRRTVDCENVKIEELFSLNDCLFLLDEWAGDLADRLATKYQFSSLDDAKLWVKSPYPDLFAFFSTFVGEDDLYSFVTYVGKKPVAVLFACRISNNCAALYANFSLVMPKFLPVYNALLISKFLQTKGFKKISYGGSEIVELDFFKRKCGGFLEITPDTFVVEPS